MNIQGLDDKIIEAASMFQGGATRDEISTHLEGCISSQELDLVYQLLDIAYKDENDFWRFVNCVCEVQEDVTEEDSEEVGEEADFEAPVAE